MASISTLFWQDGDERIVGNSRKPSTDFRYSSTNSFNSVASAPVFQDDREASLLGKQKVEKIYTYFSVEIPPQLLAERKREKKIYTIPTVLYKYF